MGPVQVVKRQAQFYKRKGTGTSEASGAYTAELFAFANAAAGTDVNVVTAVSGSKIRVISMSLSGAAGGVATVTFNSKPGGAGTAISPLYSLAANGFIESDCELGLFETTVSQGLTVTVATNTVGVRVTYILVD